MAVGRLVEECQHNPGAQFFLPHLLDIVADPDGYIQPVMQEALLMRIGGADYAMAVTTLIARTLPRPWHRADPAQPPQTSDLRARVMRAAAQIGLSPYASAP